jgi:hypothetical protein
MNPITFSIKFPQGPMVRPGMSLDTWIAKSTTGQGTFTLPDGSTCTMVEVVGDATAHVKPLLGTGYVEEFTNQYTITITPPKTEQP